MKINFKVIQKLDFSYNNIFLEKNRIIEWRDF